MSALRTLLLGLAWSLATAVVPAQAGEAAPAAALAGEFHLDGVMETGSGLATGLAAAPAGANPGR